MSVVPGLEIPEGVERVGSKLLFENDRVRVWELRLQPGEIEALHEHKLDYVMIQVDGDRVAGEFEPDSGGPWGGMTHVEGLAATIWSYPVDGQSLKAATLFATCPEGLFDGFRCDVHGNVWTSAGRNVFCLAPDGTHLGTIPIGEMVANVCFGGPQRNRLYICGQTSLYSIYLNTRAAV